MKKYVNKRRASTLIEFKRVIVAASGDVSRTIPLFSVNQNCDGKLSRESLELLRKVTQVILF